MYEHSINTEQYDYTLEDFQKEVEWIEKFFTKDVCNGMTGETIWVTNGIFEVDSFVNTTVSDYHEVYGDVRINVLTKLDAFSNPFIIKLREPRAKEFRSKIKFTPKGALSLSTSFIGPGKDGTMKLEKSSNTPILQKEKYLVESCKIAFANDMSDAKYREIAENCWEFLEYNKQFAVAHKEQLKPFYGRKDVSRAIQTALSSYMDYKSFYGITYMWNGVLFIFPIKREDMKKVFRNREKIDGRRRVMPTIVKDHKRNGNDVVSHIRVGAYPLKIGGREYGFYIGSEDYSRVLSCKKQVENMKRKLKNAVIEDEFYVL